MPILFENIQDINLTHNTILKNGNQEQKHIYKYTNDNCTKYFSIDENINCIGILINNDFHVVSLINQIDSINKNDFDFLNENSIKILAGNSLGKKQIIRKKLNSISNFKFVKNICINEIDLTSAKKKINELNSLLNCMDYKISLDYAFNLNNNTEINAYYNINNGEELYLCVYHKNSICISSLTISYSNEKNEITIDSRTKIGHEGMNLNKLLRSIIILLSKYIFPDAKTIVSSAVNAISTYIMIKYFNADIVNVDETLPLYPNYDEIENYIKYKDGIETVVKLTDENIKNAEKVFNDIINKFKCEKKTGGTKKSKRCRKNKKSKKIKPKKRRKSCRRFK